MYLRNIIIYKHLFNVSIVRIKVARSTIGYSEDGMVEADNHLKLLHASILYI